MRTRFIVAFAALVLASLSQAVVVMNQLDFNQGSQFTTAASQDFEVANDALDLIVIDDFTVTAGQTQLTSVEAIMNGWNGFANASYTNGSLVGFRVEFYTSLAAAASSMTGNAGSQFVAAGGATINLLPWAFPYDRAAHVVLPVSVNLPGAGTYWVGVAARMDSTFGQLGVNATNLVLGNQNANMANAAGGWGWSGNLFGGVPDGNGTPVAKDAEYKIDAVPEPGSMIALGLGIAALVARRRRKAA